MGAREIYREIILENIEYEYLIQDSRMDREMLDEIAELIVDTVCSAHVRYVMDCMGENTTYVRNIKNVL